MRLAPVRLMLLQFCFGDLDEDYDTTLYVDQDDQLNDSHTKIETVTHGRYDEVFSEHVVHHSRKQIEAHISSSTEDLIRVMEHEQKLITKLVQFVEKLGFKLVINPFYVCGQE